MASKSLFRENPLSLSMSEAAFDEWLLQTCARGDPRIVARLKASAYQADPQSKSFFGRLWSRIRLPRLYLLVDDLFKDPLPWTTDFLDCGRGLGCTYSTPRSWEAAMCRIESNVERYPGNYVRLAFIVLLCVLYKRPLALLGILVALKMSDSLLKYTRGTERDSTKESFIFRTTSWLAKLGVWLVLLYCKVLPTLILAALLSVLVVFVHGAFRDPATWPSASQPQDNRTHRRGHAT